MNIAKAAERMSGLLLVAQVPVASTGVDGRDDDGRTVEQFETAISVLRRRCVRALVEAGVSKGRIWNAPGPRRDCGHCTSLMRDR